MLTANFDHDLPVKLPDNSSKFHSLIAALVTNSIVKLFQMYRQMKNISFCIGWRHCICKEGTEPSMLCVNSMTDAAYFLVWLTVRNSQEEIQTIVKTAGLCAPINTSKYPEVQRGMGKARIFLISLHYVISTFNYPIHLFNLAASFWNFSKFCYSASYDISEPRFTFSALILG